MSATSAMHMRAPLITFTGVDHHTPFDLLWEIVRDRPYVELGILVSDTNTARRYWTWAEALGLVSSVGVGGGTLASVGARVAFHVCGGGARWQLAADPVIEQKLTKAKRAGLVYRTQINGPRAETFMQPASTGARGAGELHDCGLVLERAGCDGVILQLQCTDGDMLERPAFWNGSGFFQYLIDGSGGRGLLPEHWPSTCGDMRVGYAGGLGSDNLLVELPKILQVASPGWWIDMESSLRVHSGQFDIEPSDTFSLEKMVSALMAFEAVLDEAFNWRALVQ